MKKKYQYRYQMYKDLQANIANIYAEIRKAGEELGITPEQKNNIGLTGAISGCHGLLAREVEEAMHAVSRRVLPSAVLDEQLRDVVKSYYGDDYDGALISTCEAGLAVSYETLFMPPTLGKGDNYRARYIAPYERHLHHQAAYGKPFPPKYKEYTAERGEAAGEYGVQGKRVYNLDVVLARLEGARHPCHGIKYDPIVDLTKVNSKKSLEKMAEIASRHADTLAGFASLGYDTPGYGYGEKDANGAPKLQKGISELAAKYDVPYVVDNAWGIPFLGTDIRKTGADVIIYSMDKASGSPTCGLIIGKEESMVQIRRGLGIHGARYGTLSSHGKAAYVGYDPGKEALAGAVAAMKILRDRPEIQTSALEGLYKIVLEEFDRLPKEMQKGWAISKSPNSGAVELNYIETWTDDHMGIPVFSMEDMYAGSHVLQNGWAQMGIVPTIGYDGNIFVSNGIGNVDEEGRLDEKTTRLVVRGMFKVVEILARFVGYID